jgi:hypothetical protein
MNRYLIPWAGAALGVIVHLAGLGLDIWLHSRDATLAAREGVLTLSNPGHLLIFVGFALTAASLLGVALLWLNDRAVGGHGTVGRALRWATVPAVGMAAAGSIWLLSLDRGHTHAHVEDHPHTDAAVAAVAGAAEDGHTHTAAASAPDALPEGTTHTHGNEVSVSPEQLVAAAEFYQKVKAESAKYEDVRVALRNGYAQITQDLPNIAAHFINPVYNSDGVLMDPAKPEVLLYTKRLDGTWRLVGVMFMSEKVTDTPPSFFGALDAWHRHENLCFTAAGVSVKPSQAECRGAFTKVTAWNLHVWTAPGATTGLFAHDFPPISPGAFPGATQAAALDPLVRAQQIP